MDDGIGFAIAFERKREDVAVARVGTGAGRRRKQENVAVRRPVRRRLVCGRLEEQLLGADAAGRFSVNVRVAAGPRRVELNAIQRPSGDHTGEFSAAASNVNRNGILRDRSICQTSSLRWTSVCTSAACLPSGERRGQFPTVAVGGVTVPIVSTSRPDRSTHTSLPADVPAERNARTPVADADAAARPFEGLKSMFSASGTASPAKRPTFSSNGCATSVPFVT